MEFATAAEAMEIGRNGWNRENFWWHKSSELPEMAFVPSNPSVLREKTAIYFGELLEYLLYSSHWKHREIPRPF